MTNNNNQPISGFFIYKNSHNQNVYYDIFSKNAYIISKKDEKQYNIYSYRFVMSVVLGIMLVLVFNMKLWIGITAGILCYVIFSVLFRKRFLDNLPIDKKFVKTKRENLIVSLAKESSYGKLIMLLIVPIIIIVLAVINLKTGDLSDQQIIGQYVLILLAAAFAVVYGSATVLKTVKKY